MPYAPHDDIRIYYEVAGTGPPLVLAHGATGDTTFWTGYGYVERLKTAYTTIAFDARGHGRSDKPHAYQAYDYRLMAGDVNAVMDALGLPATAYWGYSMGGIVGLALAALFPDRLTALIAGGAAPFGPSDTEAPDPLLEIIRRGIEEGADVVVEEMRKWAGSITTQYEERLRKLDFRAMAAYLEYAQFHRPRLLEAAGQIKIPCLLYAGEADEEAVSFGQRLAEQLSIAQFFSLPGLGHVGASDATDLTVPAVLTFLSEVDE